MLKNKKYLIVVAGPTAVGKTALSIQLAKHFKTEIVSADSRQFYKEMSIGTAKPNKNELSEVKHHFIDTKSCTELYGAGHFAKDAQEVIETIFEEKNLAIVVGGSGLYINALLYGMDEFEEVPEYIREYLNSEFKKNGIDWLQNELKKVDVAYFEKVDQQNPQRMIRALEIFNHTGNPYSSYIQTDSKKQNYNTLNFFVNTEREMLYQKINTRVDEMMENGLLEEVISLQHLKQNNALKTVGYKELFEYLENKHSLETAIKLIKQHTRNYAKRQITWFKKQSDFISVIPNELNKMIEIITEKIKIE